MTADRASSRRLATVCDAFRTRLWPVPAAGVVVAVVAGVLVPRLDARLDSTLQEHVSGYLFGGGAEAARSVLTVVASSMITVTALTFSLTVVALQLAGSQYSPRVLRTFASDAAVRWTLALFVATFIYALTVLRTVRGQAEGHTEFVPAMAVSVAYLLTVASVVALVVFLSHLSTKIRVETMMRVVHDEASTTIRVLQPRGHPVPVPPVPADAHVLVAGSSGFLTSIDEAGLVKAAIECAMVVQIDRSPGNSLVAGTPVGRFWSADRPVISSLSQQEAFQAASANALRTGFERTASQDIGFGLRQLTDIAVKALSPGINDPTTAVHALGHSSALLCSLAGTSLGMR